MRHCPWCGGEVGEAAAFCGHCGEGVALAGAQATVTCAGCSSVTPGSARHCINCGAALGGRQCPRCAQRVSESARFCPACRFELTPVASTRAVPVAAPEQPQQPVERPPVAAPPTIEEQPPAAEAGVAPRPATAPLGVAAMDGGVPPATARGQRGRRWIAAVGVVVFLAVGGGVLAVFLLGGGGGGDNADSLSFPEVDAPDAALVARLNETYASLPTGEGATDLEQVRSLVGAPDAFQVSFERGGAAGDGAEVRYETWYYFDLQSAFEFADGKLIGNLPIDPPAALTLLPRKYDPAAFTRGMPWSEVAKLLVEPLGVEARAVPGEFGAELTFYAGEQLLVAFDENGLVYAESIPLTAGSAP